MISSASGIARASERSRFAVIALCTAALLAAAGCGGSARDEGFAVTDPAADEAGTARPADYSYTIPDGTGELLDMGRPLDLLPGQMDVRVGEIIEIINLDERGHLVGPFFVGAHETVRHEFSAPGTFVGECSVHSSGQITITVL